VPWRVDPALCGGGFFFEAVCHTFDFLDFLFGPIDDVHGIAANKAGPYRPEDTVVASYRFASGVLGCGAWSYAADLDFEVNEIVGSRGSLFFSTAEPVAIRLVRDGQTTEFAVGDPPHVHQPLIQTMSMS
jgi:predicted dehydrogenase